MPKPELSKTGRRRPWILTFFGLLAIGGLVSMPIIAGKTGGEQPDLVRFLGHFHPVLLHLPIGVFVMVLLQELGVMFFRRGRDGGNSSLFPMFFAAASAIVAVIAGFLLYHGHPDDYATNELAERHLWAGLAFSILAVLTFLLKAWTVALAANPAWFRLLLFTSVGVMGFASHDGASITHGSDYLTQYAPEPVRKILGLKPSENKSSAKPSDNPVVYTEIVAPILERRCVSCHKADKAKGRLRMDTYEMLVKGGAEGPAIVPGKAAESNIIIRIDLPEDDDEHMPKKGNPDIDPAELAVLKWWLNEGADPAKKLKDQPVPAEIQDALAKLTAAMPAMAKAGEPKGHPAPADAPASAAPDEALKKSVAEIAKTYPGAVAFESQQSALVTFTAVSMRASFDDQGFAKLAPLLGSFSTIDLSATRVTDQSVAALANAKNLRSIRLAETPVTDAAIDTLAKLPTLQSVNLYGTKVTDAGVIKLSSLPNLKHLYLWQTGVTPETVKALREKLPQCEIVTGT